MGSSVFGIVFAIGYIAFIAWNVYKLRDIAKNPQKYELVKGREHYRKSFWYESGYERYGKHYHAYLILGLPFAFLFPVLFWVFGDFIQKILFIPNDAIPLRTPGVLIGTIAAIFYGISLEQFVLFSINKPIFVAARLYFAGSNNYVKAWRNVFLWLLVLGILCLPIMAIGINAYSFADEEKIVTHGVLSLREKEIPYGTVISGETTYSYDRENDTFTFRYKIATSDGSELDVCDFGMEGACYIDTMLKQHGIAMTYGMIDEDTYEQIKTACGEKTLQFVEQCFIIDSR